MDALNYFLQLLAGTLQTPIPWQEYLQLIDRMFFFISMNLLDEAKRNLLCSAVEGHALTFARIHHLVPENAELTETMKAEWDLCLNGSRSLIQKAHSLARNGNVSNQEQNLAVLLNALFEQYY